MKCSTSSGMSSARSRSGGTTIGMTLSRKYRSSRKRRRGSRPAGPCSSPRARAHRPGPARAADRLDHLLLQHPQHLGLRLQAHVADLVEEDRAAVAPSNLPRRSARARERAPHVAEQLAFDQLFGNRRAVHLDERLVAPAAQRVNRARDQLFAGAVLAEESARGRWSAPPSPPARAAAA